MEKQASPKKKLLKFLPRAASAVNFQWDPFSPRDKRSDNTYKLKAHSAPRILIIPDEVRRKGKNGSFETPKEPTSPKISCMGQIKHKNKNKKKEAKRGSPSQATKPVSSLLQAKKRGSALKRLFSGTKSKKKCDACNENNNKASVPDRAPPALNQTKRFASGRDSCLANFDWTAQILPVESDRRNKEREDGDNQEGEEIIIPFSAPILVGDGVALQPRKEVNLWKRRTMNPPRPLQL